MANKRRATSPIGSGAWQVTQAELAKELARAYAEIRKHVATSGVVFDREVCARADAAEHDQTPWDDCKVAFGVEDEEAEQAEGFAYFRWHALRFPRGTGCINCPGIWARLQRKF